MHGEELVIGGNPAQALRLIEEHNQRAVAARAEAAAIAAETERFTDQYWQGRNISPRAGSLATREHRPYFVQN